MNSTGEQDGMEYVVKLRGLPWSTTVEDVVDFLGGNECQIMGDREGIHLVKTTEGRATGECFVECLSQRDVELALAKHRQNMGHRYIEVFKVKKIEMDWILKRRPDDSMNVSNGAGAQFRGGGVGRGSGYGYGVQECETYVRLRGLPFECTEEDIETFFEGLEIAPNGIHLVMDSMGKTTGAYCQFVDPKTAQQSLLRDKQCIGHRYVELFRVTAPELRSTVDQLVQRTRRHTPYGGRPGPYDRPVLNRDQHPGMGMGRGRQMGGMVVPPRSGPVRYFHRNNLSNGSGGGGGGGLGRMPYGGGQNWDTYGDEMESPPPSAWNRGGGGGGNSYQLQSHAHPPPLMPGLRNNVRRLGGGGGGGMSMGGGGGGGGGLISGGMIGIFPILMRGLPWAANEDDIRNFFLPLHIEEVEIIYDETNRPSGSARAYFSSEEEVNIALQKDKERMGTRYIELFVE